MHEPLEALPLENVSQEFEALVPDCTVYLRNMTPISSRK